MLHWRRLQGRNILHGRRLQDVFKTSSVMTNFTKTNVCWGVLFMQSNFFICFSLPWKKLYKYKVKEAIELAKTLWLFAQKASPSNVFFFSVHVNASLKFLWALWGLSEGTQALGHSEDTWALGGHSKGTRVLGHLSHSGTRVLRALRHWGTWALGQSGTSALRALGQSSSQATRALEAHYLGRLVCMKTAKYLLPEN